MAPTSGAASTDATTDATSTTGPGNAEGPMPAWFSDWRTATGRTEDALRDGGKWTDQLCAAPVLEVVNAAGLGFPTANALRVSYENPGECLMVQTTDQWPAPEAGEYLFFRTYLRIEIPDGEMLGFPHPIHLGRPAAPDAAYSTWFNFNAPSAGVSPFVLQLGGGPQWPDTGWQWGFAVGETYRLELRVFRETESTARVDIRVHDGSGALVAESPDWHNGETGPNERNLADSAPTFPVEDASFRLLELGNNDPLGLLAGAERYLYFGGTAIVLSPDHDDWPGPYPSAAEAR